MTLTLVVVGRDELDDGGPVAFRVAGRGVIIGRSPQADWCLPDPDNHVSSRHCEIRYRDGAYVLVDRSTNGTFVNGSGQRLDAPHSIVDGDRIALGGYELTARIDDETVEEPSHDEAATTERAASSRHERPVGEDSPDDRPIPDDPSADSNAVALLRHMIKGLTRMMDARAKAKAELGMQPTVIEIEGNNPLKFIRTPDRALDALLQPPKPGFMSAARAIDDAFLDLQAHEIALTAATHLAIERSLKKFSPATVRARWRCPRLARFFPSLHEAILWRRYESDFEGAVNGAAETFTDLFAVEFRREYQRQVQDAKKRRPRV